MNLTLPGSPRYQPKDLKEIFGYDNLYVPLGRVEFANIDVLHEIGKIPKQDYDKFTPDVRKRILEITTTDVDTYEREVTKHDIRAWVHKAQEIAGPEIGKWFHVMLTSYDPLESARILQFSHSFRGPLQSKIKQLIQALIYLVDAHKNTFQVGRTHGQHALPITAGFWFATLLYRILYNANEAHAKAGLLRGKISGAVGAYNAQYGLLEGKYATEFERKVLDKLGLQASPISTQILPPEPLAYYLHSLVLLSGSLGQLARDFQNLMRTEIAEVAEPFKKGQVASSTMAHKRNPINFENTEGMFIRTKNEYGKVLDTLISEHQRNLVASPVYRDFPIIPINVCVQLDTLLRIEKEDPDKVPFLQRIRVDDARMSSNFKLSRHVILAEPLYIALQMAGYTGDGHKLMNEILVPRSHESGRLLVEELQEYAKGNTQVAEAYEAIPEETKALFFKPEQYTGIASKKSEEIMELAQSTVSQWN